MSEKIKNNDQLSQLLTILFGNKRVEISNEKRWSELTGLFNWSLPDNVIIRMREKNIFPTDDQMLL